MQGKNNNNNKTRINRMFGKKPCPCQLNEVTESRSRSHKDQSRPKVYVHQICILYLAKIKSCMPGYCSGQTYKQTDLKQYSWPFGPGRGRTLRKVTHPWMGIPEARLSWRSFCSTLLAWTWHISPRKVSDSVSFPYPCRCSRQKSTNGKRKAWETRINWLG